jgi:hypothetical protein
MANSLLQTWWTAFFGQNSTARPQQELKIPTTNISGKQLWRMRQTSTT